MINFAKPPTDSILHVFQQGNSEIKKKTSCFHQKMEKSITKTILNKKCKVKFGNIRLKIYTITRVVLFDSNVPKSQQNNLDNIKS